MPFTQNFGQAPLKSGEEQLVDGRWLLGLAGGENFSYALGVTATGTTQATAAPLPANAFLVDVDASTASTGLGVALPFAVPGTALLVYNNTANTITVYPNVKNNPATAAQDTINNGTSVTIATHVAEIFFCAKAGVWAAK